MLFHLLCDPVSVEAFNQSTCLQHSSDPLECFYLFIYFYCFLLSTTKLTKTISLKLKSQWCIYTIGLISIASNWIVVCSCCTFKSSIHCTHFLNMKNGLYRTLLINSLSTHTNIVIFNSKILYSNFIYVKNYVHLRTFY